MVLYPRTLLKGNLRAQEPKSVSNQLYGTLSLPKGGNSYGMGATVVETSDNKDVGLSKDQLKGSSHSIEGMVGDITHKGVNQLLMLSEINKSNLQKVNSNLIHQISNTDILILAYERIQSNPGNLTPGPANETLDGIDNKFINNLSKILLSGKFSFKRARRVFIPQPNKPGEMRSIGVVSPREKIVQKAIQLVLNAI